MKTIDSEVGVQSSEVRGQESKETDPRYKKALEGWQELARASEPLDAWNGAVEKRYLPCPFCGGEARVRMHKAKDIEQQRDLWAVSCNQACACLTGESELEAFIAWNSRGVSAGSPFDLAKVVYWAREACETERAHYETGDDAEYCPSWLPELEAAISAFSLEPSALATGGGR